MQTTQPDFFNSNLLETVFARPNFANHGIRQTCKATVKAPAIKNYLDLNFGREQLSRFLVFCHGTRSRGPRRLVIDDILFLR